MRTLYGDRWTFSSSELTFADTAYTAEALGAHTDGTYYTAPPGVQVLHCLGRDAAGKGGESLLVDGLYVAQTLRSRHPDDFAVLTQCHFDHQLVLLKVNY